MERSYNRQALSMIHLILTGEKMYYVEASRFVACSSGTGCGEALRIDLPVQRWDYAVTVANEASGTISAQRHIPGKSGGRIWKLSFDPTTTEDSAANCTSDDGYCKYQ